MHGFIFSELRKFVGDKYSSSMWRHLLRDSGVGYKNYWPIEVYPDQELLALLKTVTEITDIDQSEFLEDFGIFLAPDLIEMYVDLVNPEWTTLDLLEHTETNIHTAVRTKNLDAKPPQLKVERISPNTVTIKYHSRRKLCRLLKGIIKGVARYYNERVKIKETSCMHDGASHCTFTVSIIN